MRTFFYFVPDRHALTREQAAELGLAYAFERGIDCRQAQRGPEGKAGVVFAQQDSYADGALGYHADRQTWRKFPDRDIWVGFYKDAPPGPEGLARDTVLDGLPLLLGDGQHWSVPLARSYSERGEGETTELTWTVCLPQKLDLAADGKWITCGVVARYATLWELAEGWLRVRDGTGTDDDRKRFDFQGQIDGAVLALSASYRLSRVEAALLGLFTDDLAGQVLDALVDLQTLLAFCKKKAMTEASQNPPASPGGSASSAGPAAATPTTDQP